MDEKKNAKGPSVAYFCMEYGIHSALKIYSGGLGMLAGDYVKEASDSNVDMCAVGFLYRFGYFTQSLSMDGQQIANYETQNFGSLPIERQLDKDGNPKRTPAKTENAQNFLQFDRHGDVLDNFFKNFVRQCKEPSRFGFYRVAADQAEHLISVMKELLKNPEANKELLAPHKVDISEYENKVKAEQAKSVEPQNKEENEKGKRRETGTSPN